jgi:hypothetical protein
MRPAPKSVTDNFHVVQAKSLDEIRRDQWNELRNGSGPATAQAFKAARS